MGLLKVNELLKKANVLNELVHHPGYALLKQLAFDIDLSPNETLHGDAFHQDLYYKACQREGIKKLFAAVEQHLYVLKAQLKP